MVGTAASRWATQLGGSGRSTTCVGVANGADVGSALALDAATIVSGAAGADAAAACPTGAMASETRSGRGNCDAVVGVGISGEAAACAGAVGRGDCSGAVATIAGCGGLGRPVVAAELESGSVIDNGGVSKPVGAPGGCAASMSPSGARRDCGIASGLAAGVRPGGAGLGVSVPSFAVSAVSGVSGVAMRPGVANDDGAAVAIDDDADSSVVIETGR